MARSDGAAGLLIAGLELGASSSMEGEMAALASAGIRAFLLPGSLLAEPERLLALTESARRIVGAAGPALVALGGASVPEFGLPFCPDIVGPLGLAALGSKAAARRSGRRLGQLAAASGVDLVLGPPLDLASDPKDPRGVLDRFGEEPEAAGALAAAFIRGMAAGGVGACVGRFPGLGSLCAEAGDPRASVCLPAERLEGSEMRPFARAVRAGAAAVLVGRALVPALEPERIPAARSARVIEGRLRESFGFRGLALGDEVGTEADPREAALLGALAGCDLSLVRGKDEALAAAAALVAAASTGRLPSARIAVARRRLDAFAAAGALRGKAAAASGGGRASARIERDREESLTLLKGSLGPLEGRGRRLVLVFMAPSGSPDAAEPAEVEAALRGGLGEAEYLFLPADPPPAAAARLAERLAAVAAAGPASGAVLSYDAHLRPSQEGLARLVEESVTDFCLVAMRDPYDAAFFPRARGLAAAYGYSPRGLGAAARLLAGGGSPRGHCPVEVIGIEV